jgi:PAS domain-containing protein
LTEGGTMEIQHLGRALKHALTRPGTYILTAIVGSIINVYGQLLVPWLRGDDAITEWNRQCDANAGLVMLSVILGYLFPLFVSTFSAVATRYRTRHVEELAEFPDHKPDPVFRADRNGQVLSMGAATEELFRKHQVERAQQILGDDAWQAVLEAAATEATATKTVYFDRRAAPSTCT